MSLLFQCINLGGRPHGLKEHPAPFEKSPRPDPTDSVNGFSFDGRSPAMLSRFTLTLDSACGNFPRQPAGKAVGRVTGRPLDNVRVIKRNQVT